MSRPAHVAACIRGDGSVASATTSGPVAIGEVFEARGIVFGCCHNESANAAFGVRGTCSTSVDSIVLAGYVVLVASAARHGEDGWMCVPGCLKLANPSPISPALPSMSMRTIL